MMRIAVHLPEEPLVPLVLLLAVMLHRQSRLMTGAGAARRRTRLRQDDQRMRMQTKGQGRGEGLLQQHRLKNQEHGAVQQDLARNQRRQQHQRPRLRPAVVPGAAQQRWHASELQVLAPQAAVVLRTLKHRGLHKKLARKFAGQRQLQLQRLWHLRRQLRTKDGRLPQQIRRKARKVQMLRRRRAPRANHKEAIKQLGIGPPGKVIDQVIVWVIGIVTALAARKIVAAGGRLVVLRLAVSTLHPQELTRRNPRELRRGRDRSARTRR